MTASAVNQYGNEPGGFPHSYNATRNDYIEVWTQQTVITHCLLETIVTLYCTQSSTIGLRRQINHNDLLARYHQPFMSFDLCVSTRLPFDILSGASAMRCFSGLLVHHQAVFAL